MFTEPQLSELADRYPNLTPDEIRHKARQVERRDREEGLNDPLAYLNSALHHMSQRQPRSRPHDEASKTPKARGSFREDGSWDERLADASETEADIRELVATVARLNLSPSDAIGIVTSMPRLAAAFRDATLEAMLALDAKPLTVQCGLTYGPADWLHAAWSCLQTSTSAEEFAKRSILRALAPTA